MQTWRSVASRITLVVFTLSAFLFTFATAQEIELLVWAVRDRYEVPLDAWYEENPDIRINYEVVPWEHTLDQLIRSAAAGRAPDVVVLDRPWIPILAALGHLEPLDDVVANWPQDEIEDFFGESWQYGQVGGVQYAVPFAQFGRALYYRADWFEEAGLDAPTTWDDVVEAGQVLTNGDRWGLSVRGARDDGTTQGWLPIFAAMGGEFVDGVPQIDSEAGVEALRLYHELVFEHEIMSPETHTYGSGEARGAFMGGRAAMAIIGSHIAPAVEEAGISYGDFEMTHIPRPSEDMPIRNVHTGFLWAVHDQSGHKEEAAEFVRYLTNPDNSFWFNVGYMETVRRSVVDMPDYREQKPWVDFIVQDIEHSEPLPEHPLYAQMSDAIQLALQEVLSNPNADPAAVAADLAREIESIVD